MPNLPAKRKKLLILAKKLELSQTFCEWLQLFPVLYLSFWYLLSPRYQKAKIVLQMNFQNKKWLSYNTIKQPAMKLSLTFSQFFSSHWLLQKCFFSFLIKAFANFEKLIRFHWQAFIVYKNGDNLKILIEIFCQVIVSSAI